MLRKYASAAILDAQIDRPTQATEGRTTMAGRVPQALRRTAHRVEFEYSPRPGYLYVRSRMISSRCNDNFDEFSAEEIKGNGRTTGWKTFIGKPVFVNHHNEDHRRARGVIIDAALHEDRNPDGSPDTWVEGLMEVDAVRFPRLAARILAGDIDRTSMGVDVDQSECSKCGNRATSPLEYCAHIPAMKGRRIRTFTAGGSPTDHLVRERCYGLRFFENSLLVEEPADPTAFFLDRPVEGPKLASRTASRSSAREATAMHIEAGVHRCARCFSADTLTMLGTIECRSCTHVAGVGERYAAPKMPTRPKFPNPGDHPSYQLLEPHEDHIMDHWHQATDEEKRQGMRWYSDAQILNKAVAHHTGYSEDTTAGVLSAYSPQVEWNTNMHNGIRSLHEGRPLGQGEGTNIMDLHPQLASKMMHEGQSNHEALNGPKTNAFAHLIQHGGMDPENPEEYSKRVCVDRHAMSVACGEQLTHDYQKKAAAKVLGNAHYYGHVEKMFQNAAGRASEHEGYDIAPHQVQAVTWLVRQRKNLEDNERLRKTVETVGGNELRKTRELRGEMGLELPEHNIHARRKSTSGSRHPFVRNAIGETKAPADIDTLRDENCPVCGESTSYDGNKCAVCGFVQPPPEFQDPDLELAKKLDLRKDDADPNGMDVSDVQGVEDSINDPDRDGLDDVTGEPMGEPGDLECPVCGKTFSSQPTSISTENPEAGGLGVDDPEQADVDAQEGVEDDGNAAEGDICPNCGQGILEPPSVAEEEAGMAPEDAAEAGEPGSGDPTVDPEADPDDPHGDPDADPKSDDEEDPDREEQFGHDEDEDVPEDEEPEDDHDPVQFGEKDDEEDEDEEDPRDRPAERNPWKR